MATKGIELGTAYIHINARTDRIKGQIQSAMDKAGASGAKTFEKHGKKAGQGFGKSFGGELSQAMPLSGFRSSLKQYEGVAAKSGAAAGKALGVAFTAAATAGIAGLGYTLFKGFERYSAIDAANQRLKNLNKTFQQTGKAAIDVNRVMADVGAVVEGTPYSIADGFTQATGAIALGVTDIKRYMTVITDAAAFAGDDIANIGEAFNQVINQGNLDAGILSGQLRNIPIRAWLNEVYGGTEDMTKAISDGRVGIEQLQYVIERFANGTAKTAGDTIAGSVKNMQTAFAKLGAEILTALFGGPTQDATNGIKEAVDTITGKVKDLSAWVTDHREDIKKFFDSALDVMKSVVDAIKRVTDSLGGVENAAKIAGGAFIAWKTGKVLASIGEAATQIGGITSALKGVPGAATAAGTSISGLAAIVRGGPWALLATALAVSGHNMLTGWKIPDVDPGAPGVSVIPPRVQGPGIGPSLPNLPGNPDATGGITVGNPLDAITGARPTLGGGGPVDYKQWYGGGATPPGDGPPPDLLPGSGSGGGAGGGSSTLPKPTVPFNQNLPVWAQGGTNDPSMFSAQSSWLDQRHELEEKRAYLTELEASGVAEAAQIQDAKNAVLQAERDMHEQDLRLQEAKQSSYKQATETGQKTADQFSTMASDLGSVVQLDEDLGISRGLVGMAENLFKFLAGLAAAPVKGLLSGITEQLKPYTVEAQMEALSGGGGSSGGGGGLFGNMQNLLGGAFSSGGFGGGGFPGQLTPEMVDQIATQQFGLTRGSTLRDEPGSYHNTGQATDYNGPAGQMAAFAQFMSTNFGTGLSELIHDAPGFAGNINDGKTVGAFGGFFNEAQAGRHDDHAHIATQTPRGAAPSLPSLPFAGGGGGQGALMNLMMNAMGGGYGAGSPAMAQMKGSGAKAAVYQAMLQAGFPPSEWAALEQLVTNESGFRPDARNPSSGAFGMFQFLGHENDKYGALGGYSPDPAMQSRAGMQYIKDRYGSPSQAWQFWQQNQANGNAWYATGGDVPGAGTRDTVPAMLTPGEHVLTTKDVAALGGHSGVYNFRNALHRNTGGPGFPLTPQEELNTTPVDDAPTAPAPGPVQGPEDVAGPSFAPPPAPAPFGGGTQVTTPEPGPVSPDLAPQMAPSAPPMLGPDGSPVKGPDGRPLGMDGKPIQAPANPQDEALARLAGFIPKAAKANTVAGTSNLSRIWMTGAEVVNGLIDQGASAASTAVSAAITGASFGAGAAGASQAGAAGAQFAIGLGTEAAKRGVSYWAQMGGIASDAIVEQMFPFGAPSAIGFDSAQNSINGLIEQDKKAKRPGGVYDSGGILEPGGVAVNMSRQPESVLTQQQWDLMKQTAPAQQSHGINIENISVSDVDELSRSLAARQRLAAMQYTGRPGM